jgi:serine/threonine-protein kinase
MLVEVRRMLRLANELIEAPGGPIEPRDELGKAMRRFFLGRVDYARAALRRIGESDALITSPRKWLVDPTQPVTRPPTGGHATVESSNDAPESGEPTAVTEPAASGELDRLPTGPQVELASSTSHSQVTRGPGSHWLMWLLLPMLGAGIAVVAMLAIGPSLQRSVEPTPAASEAVAPPPTSAEGESPSDIARRSPATFAAGEYNTVPKKPPGTIRWWFSTSPKGAQVFIDGEPHGTTPTFVHVPIGEEPLDIRLELDGYEPHTLQLPPANDQTFAPQLQPLAEEKEDDKPASKKRVRKPSAPVEAPQDEAPPTPGKKSFVPAPDSLRDSG